MRDSILFLFDRNPFLLHVCYNDLCCAAFFFGQSSLYKNKIMKQKAIFNQVSEWIFFWIILEATDDKIINGAINLN